MATPSFKQRLAQTQGGGDTPTPPVGEPPVLPELVPCECELPGLIGEFPVLG